MGMKTWIGSKITYSLNSCKLWSSFWILDKNFTLGIFLYFVWIFHWIFEREIFGEFWISTGLFFGNFRSISYLLPTTLPGTSEYIFLKPSVFYWNFLKNSSIKNIIYQLQRPFSWEKFVLPILFLRGSFTFTDFSRSELFQLYYCAKY
jgi:hypothetical protein